MKFTIACRGSKLSLAQAAIFQSRINENHPGIQFDLHIVKTKGDLNPETPIDQIEGKDIFTNEVQLALESGNADFAVHSMKDVSHLSFFGNHQTAVFDRGVLHDVAIFNGQIEDLLKRGQTIRIGTSSPRRASLGIRFLKKALPRLHSEVRIEDQAIRGNVDTRLRKLDRGEYDGIILSLEGLNRLLKYGDHTGELKGLLKGKKKMVLSLFHCPPAANQAALIAETRKQNQEAIEILQSINHEELLSMTSAERAVIDRYGYQGCSQHFGVFSSRVRNVAYTYASGIDPEENEFVYWDFAKPQDIDPEEVLYFKDILHQAFNYRSLDVHATDLNRRICFITHRRTTDAFELDILKDKLVWTSGTDTWFYLAKRGIWVEGCADGLGIHDIMKIWTGDLFSYGWDDALVLTNAKSSVAYDGNINTVATYDLEATFAEEVTTLLRMAPAIFWTSYQQYYFYQPYTAEHAIHLCAAGRTAQLIEAAGETPVIFPTIKAFKQWKGII